MAAFKAAIKKGSATPEEAYAIFDALETVPVDFMLGTWKGSEFYTGHLMDGKLESSSWYGKRFNGVDQVDPLVFNANDGGIFACDPVAAFMNAEARIPDVQEKVETHQPAARLRTVVTRGEPTAAMIYNQLPIIDFFRKVDDNTVLGLMDNPTIPGHNFFFVLRRAESG